jgi:hypothetical protein
MLRAMEQAERLHEQSWYVWIEGGDVVGPVSANQVARGIKAGRVPSDASVQRHGDVWWSGVLDAPDIIEALKEI